MSGLVELPGGAPAPLWVSLAIFDFAVNVLCAAALLPSYGALMGVVRPIERTASAILSEPKFGPPRPF